MAKLEPQASTATVKQEAQVEPQASNSTVKQEAGQGERPEEESVPPETEVATLAAVPEKSPSLWTRFKGFCCCCCSKSGDVAQAINQTEEGEDRESWGSKVGYILTLVGYAVGFGNIWRFPYLFHKHGGLAFLIPYFTMLVVAGIPLFFLELAIGQRLRKGALGSWNEISPYLGGLGIACGFVCFYCVMYYNTLLAWVISYVVDSFRSELPWKSCEYQFELYGSKLSKKEITNNTFFHPVPTECLLAKQPSKYYWYRKTLDISESISEPGSFNVYMMIYLTLAWLMVAAILINGIKSSEKVVYFTALFPYVTLICFFIANFFNEGWANGYTVLLNPDFSKLLEPTTWLIAGTQIFFSLGVAFGCLIVFASYLPANNNCYKDAVSVSIINCATSIFASLVIFPVLGSQGTRAYNECVLFRKFEFLKYEQAIQDSDYAKGMDFLKTLVDTHYQILPSGGHGSLVNYDQINSGSIYSYLARNSEKDLWSKIDLVEGQKMQTTCDLENEIRAGGSGTGLVFIAFAEAAKHLPVPQFFCFLFFMMLFTLGIDSGFGTAEGAIAAVIDLKYLKWPRWVITVLICGSLWVISIVFSFGWGQYVQVFLDQFIANWSLLIIAFFETVGVAYVYGLAKFSYDIKLMTGSKPNLYMLICWKFVTPVFLICILLGSVISEIRSGYKYSKYNRKTGQTEDVLLPPWLLALGFFFLLTIIIWVPLQAALQCCKKSLLKEEKPNFFPEEELRQERNMTEEDDIGDFDALDRLVMGNSLHDLQEERKSVSVNDLPEKFSNLTP